MIPKARFAPPATPKAMREREIDIAVTGGFHGGVPPHRVPVGFSSSISNFVPEPDGSITPRSVLSKYDPSDFTTSGPVLGAFETYDGVGRFMGVAISSHTLQLLTGTSGYSWRQLSYSSSILTHLQGRISADSLHYFDLTTIFTTTEQETYCIFSSNAANSLKFFVPAFNATTYSDFSWADSIGSTSGAKALCSINDRLLLFNTISAGGGRLPTRVVWSARGNPRSFLIADGAGAEDVLEMKGSGQAAVRWNEFVLLFTETEIWKAIPTEDDYAFRFYRIIDAVGTPWPRTIAATPRGVVFLGVDREVYITDGTSMVPLGPVGASGPSRVKALFQPSAGDVVRAIMPERWWAMYNKEANRYELYYSTNDVAAGTQDYFPTQAIFYDFATASWWPQTFPHGLSSGVESVDYDYINTVNNDILSLASFQPNVFDSFGTAFRVTSTLTRDHGDVLDARWRSPGLNSSSRKLHLKEVWTQYSSNSTSVGSILVGSARAAAEGLDSQGTASFGVAGTSSFVPVWATDSQPCFELRITDGGRPHIQAFRATLQDASKF